MEQSASVVEDEAGKEHGSGEGVPNSYVESEDHACEADADHSEEAHEQESSHPFEVCFGDEDIDGQADENAGCDEGGHGCGSCGAEEGGRGDEEAEKDGVDDIADDSDSWFFGQNPNAVSKDEEGN